MTSRVVRLFLVPRRNRRRGGGAVAALRGVAARARRGVPLLVVGGLAVAAWSPLWAAVRRHHYFAVREIVVRRTGHLAPDAIRAAAGIEPGTSIWDVDVAAVEARLRRTPWVRSARVRRELPARVVIQVHAYRPAAILALAEPGPVRFYYVAAGGRIFAPVGAGDPHDLPYVTGLRATDLDGTLGPRALRRALHLLRLASRAPAGLGAVSEVHVVAGHGLTLLAERPRVPIEMGWGQFDAKLARLGRVLPLWNGREAEMTAVSCLFADQVIVRTHAPAATKGGSRRAART